MKWHSLSHNFVNHVLITLFIIGNLRHFFFYFFILYKTFTLFQQITTSPKHPVYLPFTTMLVRSIARTVTGVSAFSTSPVFAASSSSILRLSSEYSPFGISSARSFASSAVNKLLIPSTICKRNSLLSSIFCPQNTLIQSSIIPSSARQYSVVTTDSPAPIIDFAKLKEITTDPFDAEKYLIVDVREPSEFVQGHIPHAVNLPYKTAPGALGLEPEEFHEAFGFDKPALDKTLVFYCLAGVRSKAAESLAATFDYQS